jgi:uncharacterized phage infection (PIP) family protein YhgE
MLVAYAASQADNFSDALKVILKEGGVWGAFVVLLILALVGVLGVLWKVVKALLKAKDDRLSDQKSMTATLSQLNLTLKDQAVESSALASRLSAETTTNNTQVKECAQQTGQKVEKLEASIVQLQQQQAILLVKLGQG